MLAMDSITSSGYQSQVHRLRGYFKQEDEDKDESGRMNEASFYKPVKYINSEAGASAPIEVHPTRQYMEITHTFDKKDLLDYHCMVRSSDPGNNVYQAVWCVSLDHFDTTVFRPVKITWEVKTSEFHSINFDVPQWELEDLKERETKAARPAFLRLVVPLQIWIDDDIVELKLQLILKTTPMNHLPGVPPLTEAQIQNSFLTVHYVELEPFQSNIHRPEADTITLCGSKGLLQSVNVCHKDPSDAATAIARHVKIVRSQICAAGSHVLTLTFTSTRAHLDLWKLPDVTKSPKTSPSNLAHLDSNENLSTLVNQSPLLAHTEFSISRNKDGKPPPLEIALSHDASRLAVFPSIDLDRSEFPAETFRLFEYCQEFTPALRDEKKLASTDGVLRPSKELLRDKHPLNRFAGYGRFHTLEWEKEKFKRTNNANVESNNKPSDDMSQEAFIGCDGLSVAVFKTFGSWEQTFHMKLSDPGVVPPKPSSSIKKENPLAPSAATSEENPTSAIEKELVSTAEDAPNCMEEPSPTAEEIFQNNTRTGAKILINSLQGPLCAWAYNKEVAIWDLKRGRLCSQRVLGWDGAARHISISTDGDIMAIVQSCYIHLYKVMSSSEMNFMATAGGIQSIGFISNSHILWYSDSAESFAIGNPVRPSPVEDYTSYSYIFNQKLHVPYSDQSTQFLYTVDIPKEFAYNKQERDKDEIEQVEGPPQRKDEPCWGMNEYSATRDLLLFVHGSTLSVYDVVRDSIAFSTFDSSAQTTMGPDTARCMSACKVPRMVDKNMTSRDLTTEAEYQFSLRISENVSGNVVLAMREPGNKTGPKIIQRLNNWGWSDFTGAHFLPCGTRYIIWNTFIIWVWLLPQNPSESITCTLLAMKTFTDLSENMHHRTQSRFHSNLTLCDHGNSAIYSLRDFPNNFQQFDFTTETLMNPEHVRHASNNIFFLLAMYNGSKTNPRHQKEIMTYAAKYVNSFPDIDSPASKFQLGVERHFWSGEDSNYWDGYDIFLRDLLRTETVGSHRIPLPVWQPSIARGKASNPIKGYMDKARLEPEMMDLAVLLIDFCLRTAKSRRDVAYLSLVLEILPDLIEQDPDLAREVMYRCAFIPVNDRAYAARRAKIQQPFKISDLLSWLPWLESGKSKVKANGASACEIQEILEAQQGSIVFHTRPVVPSNLQLDTEEAAEDMDQFTADVYVAPFDLLWHIQVPYIERSESASDDQKLKVVDESPTWWKSLFGMFLHKLNPKAFRHVRTHKMELAIFENPAIAALLEHKWNAFARSYWLARFASQCLYYVLVLAVTFCQVYMKNPEELKGAFIAIIVVAAVFLWLELLQCLQNPRGYLSSPYNYVDLVVYSLPLVASAVQIAEIVQNSGNIDATGNTRAFSFTILVIYLHLLFELRVIKGVCNFVTIILSAVGEIRIFFIIFAVSIIAFSHAFLHLLWAKTFVHEDPAPNAAGFTKGFPRAVSATYFFMGGQYDPVADKFDSDDTAFHIMMILYFFMTVILLLNVLIALINKAYNSGDNNWRRVWIDNRLRSIEAAENMSFHIPGFRKAHSWFPTEVCYTVPGKEVQEYTEKYLQKDLLSVVRLHNRDLAKPIIPFKEQAFKDLDDFFEKTPTTNEQTVDATTTSDTLSSSTPLASAGTSEKTGNLAAQTKNQEGTEASPPPTLSSSTSDPWLLEQLQSLSRRQEELQNQLEQVLTLLRSQKSED